MPEGSCLCGKCKISYSGEPHFKALCHCKDCRRITGSTYSTNLFVPDDAFKLVSGTPKSYSKPADSGHTITSYFCADCGVTLWRETTGLPGAKGVKEGIMETVSEAKPSLEFYAHQRVGWVPAVPGATQQNETP